MKKIYLTLLAALAICLSANAQKINTQKVYTGGVTFYYNYEKGYEIHIDDEKTIKTMAEKKAAKKYILSVFKKCLGNDFLKTRIGKNRFGDGPMTSHLETAHYNIDYIYKNKSSDYAYYDIEWLKSVVKPQYLKKGNLVVYMGANFKAELDDILAIYDTKTDKVYSYDEIARKPSPYDNY